MTSSSSSSPSEGEIIESDSDKATTAIASNKGTSVDRQFRTRISVSRSPSPIRSPRRHRSRTASRSPYRESRGAKRALNDDHYDRSRNDPRRFKVRYEDHPSSNISATRNKHYENGRFAASNKGPYHESRNRDNQLREKQLRGRSRSPMQSMPYRVDNESHIDRGRGRQGGRAHQRERNGRGYGESRDRLSAKQSVSDRGQPSVAAARLRQEAEYRNNQTQHTGRPDEQRNESAAKCVHPP